MGNTAFLFPGQGSQKVGMGAELMKERPDVFDRHLERADSDSGLPIRELCLEGPIEELTATEAAQPALFAVSLGMLELAREAGIEPDFVAGHSLGEYTAAVASGAIPAEVGSRLVSRRGRLMADIQAERPGGMAAIIGLEEERVRELCESASEAGIVAPANLNTPTQVVCSGEDAGVGRLIELAEEAGADKAVKLPVGAAFHSELMEPVEAAMAEELEAVDWAEPGVPLCSNASGKLCTTAAEVHEALVAQITSPVLWLECVRTLTGNGCDSFLELGSGRVLSGLVRQIDRELGTFSADSPEKLGTFVERASA